MNLWTVFVALYIVSFSFAIVMTYREQKARGDITPVFKFIGYALCTVWPLVVAVVVLFSRRLRDQGEYQSDYS